MDNRKRMKKWLQKGMSLLLTLAILTPLCIVPASAGDKIGSGDYGIQLNFTVGLNAGFGYYYGSDPYQFLQTVYCNGSLTKEEVANYALVVARRYALSYYGSGLSDALYTHEVVGCSAGSWSFDSGWTSDSGYNYNGNFYLYIGGSTADTHTQRILLDSRGKEIGVAPASGCDDPSCTLPNCALHINYPYVKTTADPDFKGRQIFDDALAQLGTTFEYNGLRYVYDSSTLSHIGDDYKGNDRGTRFHGAGTIKLYYIRSPKASAVSYQLSGAVPSGISAPSPSGQLDGDTVGVQTAASVPGYNFSGWTTTDAAVSGNSFTMPTHNVIFSGSYIPRADTPYTVEFYKQDAPGSSSYTKQTADTISSTGTTDTQIRAALNLAALNGKYAQYSLTDASKNDATTISGNGGSVLRLYYDKSTANVSYLYTGSIPAAAPVAPASAERQINTIVSVEQAPVLAGYDFSGWTTADAAISGGGFVMPGNDVTLTGAWTARTDTPYTVEYYQQNVDDDNYTLADTEHCTGTTDTVAAVPGKSYPGFTATPESLTATSNVSIQGDGTTNLKLYYNRNVNTVNYAYLGGETDTAAPALPASTSYRFGQAVPVAEVPSLAGYNFSGWTTSDAAVSGSSFTMPDTAVTLSGAWTARTDTPYTVEYYQQDIEGDGYTLADTLNGTGTTSENISHREFEGFTQTADSLTVENSTKIKSDGTTNLKLYYDRNVSTVAYAYSEEPEATAPALPVSASYRFGQAVPVAEAPSLPGYDFGGWETSDASITGGSFIMPDKDVNIVGAWLPRADTSYKVEYYLQQLDGSYIIDRTEDCAGYTNGHPDASTVTYEGFTKTDASKDAERTTTIKSDGSTILKLYFDRNRYKLTYAFTGDVDTTMPSPPEQAMYRYGDTVTVETTPPVLQGYNFGGWITSDASITGGSFIMPDKDVTLVGAWYPSDGVRFRVNYYQQNIDLIYSMQDAGNSDLIYSVQGTGNSNLIYSVAPSNENYSLIYSIDGAGVVGNYIPGIHREFEGFTESAASLAAEQTKIASDGSTVVSLYYDRNSYNLTFIYTGSTPPDVPELPTDQLYKYESSITLPTAPAGANGKVFSGWLINGEKATSSTFLMPATDTVVEGVWGEQQRGGGGGGGGTIDVKKPVLPVNFVSDGTTVDTKTVEPGNTVSAPSTPAKAGYTFAGWFRDSDCTKPWDFKEKITAATVLYAKWTPEKLTVHFNSNGGGAIMAQTVSYGDYAVEPTAPKKTGCTFAGWYADSGLSETWSFTKNAVTADTVLFAKWTPEKFTVSFKSDGGSAVAVQTVSYGDYAVEPTAPKKTGYTFAGWYADSGLTKAWSFTRSAVTSDTVLYAAWYLKATHNTVRFNSDGGSEVEAQTVVRGGYVQKPTPPVKTGCTFAGWYADSGLTRTWDFTKDTVVADITLYAAWDFAVAYNTVNFNSNGGSAVAAQTLACGGHAVEPSAPTKAGYTFAGWYADNNLSETWDFAKETIISNTVLYAKWNANVTAPVDEPIAEHHTFAINMDLVKGCLAALLLVLSLTLFIWKIMKRAKVQIYDKTGKHLLCTSDVNDGKIDIDNVLATASEPVVMVQINKFYALRHIGEVISIYLDGKELYKDKLRFDSKYLIKTK